MVEWYPDAIQRWGPAGKFGGFAAGDRAPKRGQVSHSMVGSFEGAMSVLDSPRPSSWHFSVLKDGRVFQHYPLTANTWHSNDSDDDGQVRGNIDLVGVEHEGGGPGNEGEPLTEAQLTSSINLTRWMAEQFGLTRFARYPEQAGVWTLAEHNQVGNTATACPSGRIPWVEILKKLEDDIQPVPTQDQLTLLAVDAMIHKYAYRIVGTNPFSQYIVQLMEKSSGEPADPPSFIAVDIPKGV